MRLVGSGLRGSPVWGGFLSKTLLPSLRNGSESETGLCGQCGFRSDVDVLSESAIGVKFTGDEMRPLWFEKHKQANPFQLHLICDIKRLL